MSACVVAWTSAEEHYWYQNNLKGKTFQNIVFLVVLFSLFCKIPEHER